MTKSVSSLRDRLALALVAFAVLAMAISQRPTHLLNDFDQSFYLTIAYDLDRHGVFSNGVFDDTNSTLTQPPPGMFFGPGYPLLVLAAMKIDPRFAAAVTCSVEANNKREGMGNCDVYARPMRLIHALLVALGILAIARSGELLFGSRRVFWLAGLLATAALLSETEIFSYVMTESLTFSLYSLFAWATALAWTTWRTRHFALAGFLLGLLCLTRPSFVVLMPLAAVLVVLFGRRLAGATARSPWAQAAVFAVAFAAIVGPWMTRNAVSVGKFGLTEEYGAAALIERFAYDDMTAREFALAFPYCTPGVGDLAFDQVYGKDAMHRFVYHTAGSFFHVGRERREALVWEYGRLDAVIGDIVSDELRERWWRYLLVSIPLGWCGLWVGGLWALILVPLFIWACLRAARAQPLLLVYAVPAVAMLGLHAAVANHYTRYNLILIGPFAVGAAWLISSWRTSVRARSQAPAPAP